VDIAGIKVKVYLGITRYYIGKVPCQDVVLRIDYDAGGIQKFILGGMFVARGKQHVQSILFCAIWCSIYFT
jgi:hypothetical protein